ncbi:MAG: hypothetical protein HY078_12500 [Elusimicrobia bacterium]|nr:hypothetical protein [Elusimicrobiota bacterium]
MDSARILFAVLLLNSAYADALGDGDALRSLMGGVGACEMAPAECARVYGPAPTGQAIADQPPALSGDAAAAWKKLLEKMEAKRPQILALPSTTEVAARITVTVNRSLAFETRNGTRFVVLRRSDTGGAPTIWNHYRTDLEAKELAGYSFCTFPNGGYGENARTPYARIPTPQCREFPGTSETSRADFRKELAYWLQNADKAQ